MDRSTKFQMISLMKKIIEQKASEMEIAHWGKCFDLKHVNSPKSIDIIN